MGPNLAGSTQATNTIAGEGSDLVLRAGGVPAISTPAARRRSNATFKRASLGGSKIGVAALVGDSIFGLRILRLFFEEA